MLMASTTIRRRNWVTPTLAELFENILQSGGILETPALRFIVNGKHFEKGELLKMILGLMKMMHFAAQVFPKPQIQNQRWLFSFQTSPA